MAVRFAQDETFDSYSARLAEHFVMKRRDGIIEVRMHHENKTPQWSYELHRALPQMFMAVGADRENEVMILTGTGDYWLHEFNEQSFHMDHEEFRRRCYDIWYLDGTKLQENMIWAIDIPVIAAINGPGFHTEFGLLADLTICADDARFSDAHFAFGMVPGDGQFLVLQELLGIKRANYLAYMGGGIDAPQALELGLVNEVHSRDLLLTRAWEIATQLMKSNRVVRRLTTQVVRRRWKRVFTDDFNMHFAFEVFGATVSQSVHDNEGIKEYLGLGKVQPPKSA